MLPSGLLKVLKKLTNEKTFRNLGFVCDQFVTKKIILVVSKLINGDFIGSEGRIRTADPRLMSPVL